MAGCDLACQTKIILNGGNAAGIMGANYHAIQRFDDAAFNRLNGNEVIALMNRIEDDSVKLQKILAKAAGYTGPTGKMLED